ncbi:hypothetical protein C8R44DRAFT_853095 [Mycena epipterygia]|nr:hypothetical protein C8R44DRAFT_853095 [Mycena epipterygia]
MFSRLSTRTFITVALGASKVFAVIMGYPPSGTTLQRGSELTMTWGGTSIVLFAIGLENTTSIFPIVNNVDAQKFRATITLPTFALGDYTLAFLSNDTFDFITGNTIKIVDDTSLATTSGAPPTSSTISTSSATSSSGSPSSTTTQLTKTRRKSSLTVGAIFGIVFGVVALLILSLFLVLRARRARRKLQVAPNVDAFIGLHADGGGMQQVQLPMRQNNGAPSKAVIQDGQGYLAMQLRTLQKQLEDLRGAVDHGPDRAMEQNEILQVRIRMLERELESQGTVEPPPQYLDH